MLLRLVTAIVALRETEKQKQVHDEILPNNHQCSVTRTCMTTACLPGLAQPHKAVLLSRQETNPVHTAVRSDAEFRLPAAFHPPTAVLHSSASGLSIWKP